MKLNKKNFHDLSNEERSEIYADVKIHHDTYLDSDHSFLKKIHESRFNSILTLMGDVSKKRILDAGSGEGYFLDKMNCKEKFGIELSKKRIEKSKKLYPNLNVKIGNVTDLPFKDDFFDIIVCSEVLEHVSGYEQALKEFKRCVKPDGSIIVSFPNELTVSLGRLMILKFPPREVDHINSIKPKNITQILGKNFKHSNVPKLRYPFCLYQIYRFDAVNFK